jgi:ubiquitin-protein ligase
LKVRFFHLQALVAFALVRIVLRCLLTFVIFFCLCALILRCFFSFFLKKKKSNKMEEHGCLPMETSDDEESGEPSLRDIILRRANRRNDVSKNPALLRLRHDFENLRFSHAIQLDEKVDQWGMTVRIHPSEGFYSASLSGDSEYCYPFRVSVGPEYPYEGPLVTSLQPLFHPNVDEATGRVGLELITCDWTPIMSLGGVLEALLSVMEDPVLSGSTVLNSRAAEYALHNVSRLVESVQQQQRQQINQRSFVVAFNLDEEQDENVEDCGSCRKRRDQDDFCRPDDVERQAKRSLFELNAII